jgi:hypothetical protein
MAPLKKIFKILILAILITLISAVLLIFAPPLGKRLFTYPKLEKQLEELCELRKEVPALTKLNTYKGVMHLHSYWSHDCEGTLFDLLPAAKNAGIDFIFLTDHPRGALDTLPRDYKGYYDGILIEPGTEKDGFDTWPLKNAVINWNNDADTIVKEIVNSGGLIFYAHPEEPHNWGNPYYQGMEIYNIHTDVKDEKLLPLFINLVVNRKYGKCVYRELFDEQVSILGRWDSLNNNRRIVGFSAVDTHENQSLRARLLKDGRVEWVGPNAKVLDTTRITFLNKWLFHKPDENGWIFRLMGDTYRDGFMHVTNYLFADTLNISSIRNHLLKGHLFTAFQSMGDAKGFMFHATDREGSVDCIMGDSIRLEKIKTLNAVSPYPGRFILKLNGKVVNTSEGYEYSFGDLPGKGAYRIEVHLRQGKKDIPWIYSNPIYVF